MGFDHLWEDDIAIGDDDMIGAGSGMDLIGAGSGMDLIGDDLIGAGEELLAGDSLVGRAGRRHYGAGHPGIQRAAYEHARVGVLGLGSQTLGGAGSFSLTGRPQKPFRVDRLVLADSVANNSTVTAINVGVDPEFVNNAGAPASIFAAGAFGVALRGKTAGPGMDIVVSGTMAAAGTISGGVVGRYAE